MQCYTELLPPTAVTHAVSLPFLDSSANNVVVAKTSLLQIYRIAQAQPHAIDEDQDGSKPKLVLVDEYSLAGTVTSIASIKLLNTESGGDAILIAFKDAKLSLVEWDPDNYRISTVSIHYYEGENAYAQPFGPSLANSESILTVDPSSRCAALKFGPRQLAILPFRQAGDELGEVVEDGFDPDLDVAPPSATIKRIPSGVTGSLDSPSIQTPYKASFVLPLTALDPALTHPVHLAFLHEYREPTFGILSAPIQPSIALLEERKDVLSYAVFTLDLEQRASTNLISVESLPSDLWKVVPLALPVGGALLVGTNEFVYVDQSGKTSGVAVNEFATMASSVTMADRSDLNLKLEDCELQRLDPGTGDMLVVLKDGSLAILSFALSGRNATGLNIAKVSNENGGMCIKAAPSCAVSAERDQVFIGSEDGDSTLLRWAKSVAILSRKRSHAQMLAQEPAPEGDEEAEDLDEDDLYAPTEAATKRSTSISDPKSTGTTSSYRFDVQDILPSIGPMRNVCFGRPSGLPKDKLELVAACGRSRASRLALIGKGIPVHPMSSTQFDEAKSVWAICAKAKNEASGNPDAYDNLLFAFDGDKTKVYDIMSQESLPSDVSYQERSGNEFEHEGETLYVSSLANSTRIVQCRRHEIRTYDSADLSLSQIIPMMNEETDAELQIVHVDFYDPYVLVIRDDGSVQVLRVDGSGDVEPLEAEGAIKERRWHSGCLYSGDICDGNTVAYLLGEEGGLHVFSLPDLEASYVVIGLSNLPAVLSPSAPQRRTGAKETLVEMLFADLGSTEAYQPYLILRSAMDDLTIYQPWRSSSGPWKETLRFRKVPLSYIPKFDEKAAGDSDGRPAPLRSLRLGSRFVVYVPGAKPSLIAKEACSLPKVLSLQVNRVQNLISIHREGCQHVFGVLDHEGGWQEYRLLPDIDTSTGWCVRRASLLNEEVRHVAFHDDREMYVVATCRDVDFVTGEEEAKKVSKDGKSSLQPLIRVIAPFCLILATDAQRRITSIYVHFFLPPWRDVYS